MQLLKTTVIFILIIVCRREVVSATPCPVIWNCVCPEFSNGCQTCPCNDNSTKSKPTVDTGCPYVDFLSCANECIVLDATTQCIKCDCSGSQHHPSSSPVPKHSNSPGLKLVCHSCTVTSSSKHCQTIRNCAVNELCHSRVEIIGTERKYYLDCLKKQACHQLQTDPIIGRRSTECNKCCNSNLCNKNICP